jgi:coiled-coil-helix-coiled-coil-helix domain-containing protein 10
MLCTTASLCVTNLSLADGSRHAGMALGTGSAIAHRTIDSAWGTMFGGADGGHAEPAQVQAGAQQLQQAKHPCADAATQFAECMSKNGGDMGACDFFYNAMQQCKMQNP